MEEILSRHDEKSLGKKTKAGLSCSLPGPI